MVQIDPANGRVGKVTPETRNKIHHRGHRVHNAASGCRKHGLSAADRVHGTRLQRATQMEGSNPPKQAEHSSLRDLANSALRLKSSVPLIRTLIHAHRRPPPPPATPRQLVRPRIELAGVSLLIVTCVTVGALVVIYFTRKFILADVSMPVTPVATGGGGTGGDVGTEGGSELDAPGRRRRTRDQRAADPRHAQRRCLGRFQPNRHSCR